jgi:hypothetical protein
MVVVTTAMGGGRECGRYVEGMAGADDPAVEGAAWTVRGGGARWRR